MPTAAGSGPVSPLEWGRTFSAPPVAASTPDLLAEGRLQRWIGTSPQNEQPRLTHHNVCLHLGGPKRVRRSGEGANRVADIEPYAVTVVPRGASFRWNTEGPVDFAFLFIDPNRLSRSIVEDFDQDPDAATLEDRVGFGDPVLGPLIGAMIEEIARPGPHGRVLMESLYRAVLVRLLCTHSSLRDRAVRARYALAPFRLRRVLREIDQNLGGDLDLGTLAMAAGLSRYHFSRAFRQAMGMGPCAFVLQRRIEEAKRLLGSTQIPVADVAKRCGLGGAAHFSTAFHKSTGKPPGVWRRER